MERQINTNKDRNLNKPKIIALSLTLTKIVNWTISSFLKFERITNNQACLNRCLSQRTKYKSTSKQKCRPIVYKERKIDTTPVWIKVHKRLTTMSNLSRSTKKLNKLKTSKPSNKSRRNRRICIKFYRKLQFMCLSRSKFWFLHENLKANSLGSLSTEI